ncbi:hypothetical protein PEL8287_02936 [Roseovarius litorisediminis]|uniref:TFIIB zinc-binding n=1 Tax=Roseovarius litorisediminis TaxID=1312363 RepID=A0A1Y5T3T2_9RHOB|nr:hypothetical protein [Roseovarius litorisediminis]SLN54726.1 hypothetical protein PEL8287_02936 [Roseovarius litorisediminis]
MTPKIATCSYCGMRAALLWDKARHELACASCGAPLHDIKMMPQHSETEGKKRKSIVSRRPAVIQQPRWFQEVSGNRQNQRPRHKRSKRRKPLARRVLDELWDVVEDIFD